MNAPTIVRAPIALASMPAPDPATLVDIPAPAGGRPSGYTRAERVLIAGEFGSAVIAGLTGSDRSAVAAARAVQAELRARVDYSRAPAPILTPGATQSKLAKNTLPSLGLMLTPERGLMMPALADIRRAFELTGGWNLCPLASQGCALACLVHSGQSGMPSAQRAQAVRTVMLLSRPYESGLIIGAEIRSALRRSSRVNLRLNTTSDIRWELIAPTMVSALSAAGVIMYDYTAWNPADRRESGQYHLTYSAKERAHTPDDYLIGILQSGRNVAVPFATARGAELPISWHGYRVIDGDQSDERYRDPAGVVVGLRAKGHRWRHDNSAGFIRPAVSS